MLENYIQYYIHVQVRLIDHLNIHSINGSLLLLRKHFSAGRGKNLKSHTYYMNGMVWFKVRCIIIIIQPVCVCVQTFAHIQAPEIGIINIINITTLTYEHGMDEVGGY